MAQNVGINYIPNEILYRIFAHCDGGAITIMSYVSHEMQTKTLDLNPKFNLCHYGGTYGSRNILRWANKMGFVYDRTTFTNLIAGGHLDTLVWLCSKRCLTSPMACIIAARYGHLEILRWFHGCHHSMTYGGFSAYTEAAYGGHIEILRWLHAEGYIYNQYISLAAAHGGHIRVLEWLQQNGCKFNKLNCKAAAMNGCLDALQWLHTNGCNSDESVSTAAAMGGHLDVLQWLHLNGCNWDVTTSGAAAHGGHLDVLQWLHLNGCPWDVTTSGAAVRGGHLDILQWLHLNGCPWDVTTSDAAAKCGHLDILQWLLLNGCEYAVSTPNAAAPQGHLHILKWLHCNGYPSYGSTYNAAQSNGHQKVMDWLYLNRYTEQDTLLETDNEWLGVGCQVDPWLIGWKDDKKLGFNYPNTVGWGDNIWLINKWVEPLSITVDNVWGDVIISDNVRGDEVW